MSNKLIRVFISYSHGSVQHEQRVLELSDRLRADGIDAWIDQYEEQPPQGWPLWMTDELEKADYVIIVVSEEYQRRMRSPSPPAGKGVAWESLIITQSLYDSYSQNTAFIPLLLDNTDRPFIPIQLRSFSFECLEDKGGYECLYRRISSQPKIIAPNIGKPLIFPSKKLITSNRSEAENNTISKYSTDWLNHPNDVTSVEDYYEWHESPEFWKTGAGDLFAISNREVEALWTMSKYSTVYEIWLRRFINNGGTSSRIYVLSEEYVSEGSHNLFLSVLYRHYFLGFNPRLAVLPDSDMIQKKMLGAKCDTYAVLNRSTSLLYQFPPMQYPMFVRTTHEDVISRGILAHDALLPKTIEFEKWVGEKSERQLPEAQLKEIRAEVGRICEIAGSNGID